MGDSCLIIMRERLLGEAFTGLFYYTGCALSVEFPSELVVKPLLLYIWDSSEAEVSERLVFEGILLWVALVLFLTIFGGFCADFLLLKGCSSK